jgi:hypothetical protein
MGVFRTMFGGHGGGLRFRLAPLLVLLAILAAPSARALPRYTAQYGQNCTLCHVNPTGGGMRSLYASQYIVPEEIAARGWNEGEAENLSPQISPNIAVGVDLRTLAYQLEGGAGSTFAMQGDFYVDVGLSSRYTAYIEQGISGSGEIFGLGRYSFLDSYVKAGRFLPDYGWRFSDHQMFNRRYLLEAAGSDSPGRLYGSGFEVGVSPGIFSASASLLGGSQQHGDSYAARALVQENLGPLNFGVGASVLRRQFPEGHRRSAGAFWYLGYGRTTWLGQIDETRQEGRPGRLVTHEVAVGLSRGYDLRLTYNFQDPDRDLKNGRRQRYGAGLATMPTPFLSLLVMGNYWDLDEGPHVSGDDYYEGQLVVHCFY